MIIKFLKDAINIFLLVIFIPCVSIADHTSHILHVSQALKDRAFQETHTLQLPSVLLAVQVVSSIADNKSFVPMAGLHNVTAKLADLMRAEGVLDQTQAINVSNKILADINKELIQKVFVQDIELSPSFRIKFIKKNDKKVILPNFHVSANSEYMLSYADSDVVLSPEDAIGIEDKKVLPLELINELSMICDRTLKTLAEFKVYEKEINEQELTVLCMPCVLQDSSSFMDSKIHYIAFVLEERRSFSNGVEPDDIEEDGGGKCNQNNKREHVELMLKDVSLETPLVQMNSLESITCNACGETCTGTTISAINYQFLKKHVKNKKRECLRDKEGDLYAFLIYMFGRGIGMDAVGQLKTCELRQVIIDPVCLSEFMDCSDDTMKLYVAELNRLFNTMKIEEPDTPRDVKVLNNSILHNVNSIATNQLSQLQTACGNVEAVEDVGAVGGEGYNIMNQYSIVNTQQKPNLLSMTERESVPENIVVSLRESFAYNDLIKSDELGSCDFENIATSLKSGSIINGVINNRDVVEAFNQRSLFDNSSYFWSSISTEAEEGNYGQVVNTTKTECLNNLCVSEEEGMLEICAYSNFKSNENRLHSFNNWPYESVQPKEILAKAGFYYTGNNDSVICFSCNLSLRDWKVNSCPWRAHVLQGKHCEFVKQAKGKEYIDSIQRESGAAYSSYESRLHSFNGWGHEKIQSKSLLAQAGFYYLELDDRVRCFSCHVGLCNWKENLCPWKEHAIHNRNCEFLLQVRGHDYIKAMKKDGENSYSSFQDRLESFNDWEYEQIQPKKLLAEAGFIYTKDKDLVRCFKCNLGLSMWASDNCPWREHATHNPDCDFLNQEKGQEYIKVVKSDNEEPYNSYERRLLSFSGWDYQSIKSKESLAEAGFYYTGHLDLVRCFNCKLGLSQWSLEDCPWEKHAQHNQNCGHLKQCKGNKYIEDIQREWSKIYNPRTPEFESKIARLNSFVNWPETVEQTPEILADAGFYYTGAADIVRCYYCDHGLMSFESGDDPLEQHIKAMESCAYLVLTKDKVIFDGIKRKEIKEKLLAENEKIKSNRLCKSCAEQEVSMVIIPCGHRIYCEDCTKGCNVCAKNKQEKTKILKCGKCKKSKKVSCSKCIKIPVVSDENQSCKKCNRKFHCPICEKEIKSYFKTYL